MAAWWTAESLVRLGLVGLKVGVGGCSPGKHDSHRMWPDHERYGIGGQLVMLVVGQL